MVLSPIDKKIVRHWCSMLDVRKWDAEAKQGLPKQVDADGYYTVKVYEWEPEELVMLPMMADEEGVFEVTQMIEDYINAKTKLPGRYVMTVMYGFGLYYREEGEI